MGIFCVLSPFVVKELEVSCLASLTPVGNVVRGPVAELADDLAEDEQAPVDVPALAQPLAHRAGLRGALRS